MRIALFAGLALCAALVIAHAQTDATRGFDAKIAEARAAMMADPSEALRFAREAEALAPKSGGRMERVAAQWLQGEALNRLNRSQEAAPILEAALSVAAVEAPKSKLRGDLMMARAGAAAMQGDYVNALTNFQAAHDVFAVLRELRSQSMSLLQLGAIYFDSRDYRRALDYYQRAGEVYAGDGPVDLSRLNNVANAQRELGNLEAAEKGFRDALAIAVSMDSPMLRARILTNIAEVQIAQQRFAQADATAREALRFSADGWDVFVWGVRAEAALAGGDIRDASRFIARAFNGEDLTKTAMPFRDLHKAAHQIYARLGDESLALRHLEAFKRLDDEARDVAASANTALMGARFDFTAQELKITQLRAQTLEAQQRQRTMIFLAVLAVALVVLGALVFGYLTMRRSRNKVRAANISLRDTNIALEKAMKAKSEFLATTSHEIRTPLNGILGMTQIMLMDKKITDDVRERVQIVHGAGETMRAIVDDILDVAKMESGEITISRGAFPLQRTLKDVCALWRVNAEDKGLTFVVDTAEAPADIVSDEQRLRQIVFNLLSNAVKFTDRGQVGLRAAMDGDTLVVEVSDTGVGIPAGQLDGVFEAFHQVDGGTTRSFGGTGLGLAICRNLSRALGGDVSVSSALGVGSVFTLRLPVSVLSSAAPVDRGQLPGDSSAISVLVLEGNPFNRCLVEACCAEQGLAVSTIDTLDAAIETLEVRRFEFVVVAADALPLAAGEAMGALMSISDAAGDARLIVRIGEEVALEAPAARLCGADEVLIGAFDADEFLKAIAAGDANSQRANAA